MYEQVDFHFRYQPGSESPYTLLLKYLQPKKKSRKRGKELLIDQTDESAEFPRERMILWALSAFWYPSACKTLGKFSNADLKQKARNAIYQLLQQIYYLIQMFELDPQEFVFPASTGGLNSGLKVSESTPSKENLDAAEPFMSSSSNTSPKSQASEQASLDFLLTPNEDDEALEEAFVD